MSRAPALLWKLFAFTACVLVAAQSTNAPDWGVRFADVARQAGLTTTTVYGGRDENRYILESTGCGAAFCDFDNDGFLDLFLVNGAAFEPSDAPALPSRLLINRGDGTFREATRTSGLNRVGWGQAVCAGDFDNDGFEDLFVTYWGRNALYHNDGKGRFTDLTESAGLALPGVHWSSGCAFLDYDRDGRLDLFYTHYTGMDLDETPDSEAGGCSFKGLTVACGPNGLPKTGSKLFRNRGDGRFADVSEASGVAGAELGYGLGVLTADFDDDGWPDVYVANDGVPSHLFWNNRDGTFTEDGLASGVATSLDGRTQSGMGVAAGDFDGDGRLDIFKTNFSEELPNLYRNLGDRFFDEVTTQAGLGVNSRYLGWGCGLFDFDHDGRLDIFYANGHVYPEVGRLRSSVGYKQPKVLYQNLSGGRFRDVSRLAGQAVQRPIAGRGAAFGDFDNDGDVDIVVNPMNDVPQLLRNEAESPGNWLQVKLVGKRSNRSAIGARVICITGDTRQVREVRSGGSYYSHNDLRLHFGLGEAEVIDLLEIRWPSGHIDRLRDLGVNRIQTIEERRGADSERSTVRSTRR